MAPVATATVDGRAASGGAAAASLASGRDPYLDLVRTWAILRVVTVHLLGLAPIALLWWPKPTFVAPGMPLVFFVSGALTLRALDPGRRRHLSPRGFWRDRLRRLLIPYLVYFGIVATITLAFDWLRDGDAYTVSFARMAAGLFPLINPITSPAGYSGVVHLWFLACFLWLILLAPLLVWLFRRGRWALLAGSAALLVGVPYLHLHTDVTIYPEMSALALFGFFFVLGFFYTDGTLVGGVVPGRPRGLFDGWRGVAIGLLLFAATWAAWEFDKPIAVHDSGLVHGLLGLGWLSLMLAARPWLSRLAVRLQRPIGALTKRTLTIYLYGWPTAALAEFIVDGNGWGGVGGTLLYLAIAVGALVLCVKVFGPLEDVAAGRVRRGPDASASAGAAASDKAHGHNA